MSIVTPVCPLRVLHTARGIYSRHCSLFLVTVPFAQLSEDAQRPFITQASGWHYRHPRQGRGRRQYLLHLDRDS